MREVVTKLLKFFFIQNIQVVTTGAPCHSKAMLPYSPYVRSSQGRSFGAVQPAGGQHGSFFGTICAMKKPTLRVTKWLRDIPIEGCCSLCPETLFHAASLHHRPQKAEYIERLQGEFDRHVADFHTKKTAV